MKILVNIFNRLKHNIIILLGLFMLGIFIYFRFIRERLPRDIPFTLNEIGFIFLVGLCLLYCYLIWITIKPQKNSNKTGQIIINLIVNPLENFDTFLKQISIIKLYYTLFLIWFVYTFDYIFKHYIFDYILYIMPRIVLLTAFMIDTFYFHKLFYIYSFAFLTLFILICYYIIYCIKITIKQYIEYLDYYYIIEITSRDSQDSNYCLDLEDIRWDQISINYFRDIKYYECNDYCDEFEDKTEYYLKIQRFLDMQTTALWLNYTPYNYKCIPTWNVVEKYYNYQYRQSKRMWDLKAIPQEDLSMLEKDFYELLPTTVYLQLFIETYVSISNKHKLIKIIQIIITSLYLITWLYILYVTLLSLPESTYYILLNIQDTLEPFSGIYINKYDNVSK